METKQITLWRKRVTILEAPMTLAELEKSTNKEGVLKANLIVSLDTLRAYIDDLNDLVSEKITGSEHGLQNINYKLVGATSYGDPVIQVSAQLSYL